MMLEISGVFCEELYSPPTFTDGFRTNLDPCNLYIE